MPRTTPQLSRVHGRLVTCAAPGVLSDISPRSSGLAALTAAEGIAAAAAASGMGDTSDSRMMARSGCCKDGGGSSSRWKAESSLARSLFCGAQPEARTAARQISAVARNAACMQILRPRRSADAAHREKAQPEDPARSQQADGPTVDTLKQTHDL